METDSIFQKFNNISLNDSNPFNPGRRFSLEDLKNDNLIFKHMDPSTTHIFKEYFNGNKLTKGYQLNYYLGEINMRKDKDNMGQDKRAIPFDEAINHYNNIEDTFFNNDGESPGGRSLREQLDTVVGQNDLSLLQIYCIFLEDEIQKHKKAHESAVGRPRKYYAYAYVILEVMIENVIKLCDDAKEKIKFFWMQKFYEIFIMPEDSEQGMNCNKYFLRDRSEAVDGWENNAKRYWFRRLKSKYIQIEENQADKDKDFKRKNRTNLTVFTIDPEGSTDADDGFSYYCDNGDTYIEVHFADPTSVKLSQEKLEEGACNTKGLEPGLPGNNGERLMFRNWRDIPDKESRLKERRDAYNSAKGEAEAGGHDDVMLMYQHMKELMDELIDWDGFTLEVKEEVERILNQRIETYKEAKLYQCEKQNNTIQTRSWKGNPLSPTPQSPKVRGEGEQDRGRAMGWWLGKGEGDEEEKEEMEEEGNIMNRGLGEMSKEYAKKKGVECAYYKGENHCNHFPAKCIFMHETPPKLSSSQPDQPEPCRHYLTKGKCPNKRKCLYRHGDETNTMWENRLQENNKMIIVDGTGIRACTESGLSNVCGRGGGCKFWHYEEADQEEEKNRLRLTNSPQEIMVGNKKITRCMYWPALEECLYGQWCRHWHPPVPARLNQPAHLTQKEEDRLKGTNRMEGGMEGEGEGPAGDDALELEKYNFAHPIYLNAQIEVETHYSLYHAACHLYPKSIIDACTLQIRGDEPRQITSKAQEDTLGREIKQKRNALSIKFKISFEADGTICTIDCVDIYFSKITVSNKYTLTYEAAGKYFASKPFASKSFNPPVKDKPLENEEICDVLQDVFKITEYYKEGYGTNHEDRLYYEKISIPNPPRDHGINFEVKNVITNVYTTMMQSLIEILALLSNYAIGKYTYDRIKNKYIFLEGLWRQCSGAWGYAAFENTKNTLGIGKDDINREVEANFIEHVHETLNLKHYSHSTSPLRRYVDTYIHILIKIIFNLEKESNNHPPNGEDEDPPALNEARTHLISVFNEATDGNSLPPIVNSNRHTVNTKKKIIRPRSNFQRQFKTIHFIETVKEVVGVAGYIQWTKNDTETSNELVFILDSIKISDAQYFLVQSERFTFNRKNNWFGPNVPFPPKDNEMFNEDLFINEWSYESRYKIDITLTPAKGNFKFIKHLYDNDGFALCLCDYVLNQISQKTKNMMEVGQNPYNRQELAIAYQNSGKWKWWSDQTGLEDRDLGVEDYNEDGQKIKNKSVKLYFNFIQKNKEIHRYWIDSRPDTLNRLSDAVASVPGTSTEPSPGNTSLHESDGDDLTPKPSPLNTSLPESDGDDLTPSTSPRAAPASSAEQLSRFIPRGATPQEIIDIPRGATPQEIIDILAAPPKMPMEMEIFMGLGVGVPGKEEGQITQLMQDFKVDTPTARIIHKALVGEWKTIYDIEVLLNRKDFTKVDVPGDGDCLYTAFYLALEDAGAVQGGRYSITQLPSHDGYDSKGAALRNLLYQNFNDWANMCGEALDEEALLDPTWEQRERVVYFDNGMNSRENIFRRVEGGLSEPWKVLYYAQVAEWALLACVFDINVVLYIDAHTPVDEAGNRGPRKEAQWEMDDSVYYNIKDVRPTIFLSYNGFNHYDWLKPL